MNVKSDNTALGGAIDQLGHVLLHLIHDFVEAQEKVNIFQEKWDINNRFCRIYCKEGEEWNFCYVLPQKVGMPITLVVSMSLQMWWIESTFYFCTVFETGWDVVEQYFDAPVLSLALHKFVKLTELNPEFAELPKVDILDNPFNYMLEVYMDNCI